MKKLFTATLMVAGAAALLCGCSKSETPKPDGETVTETVLPAELMETVKSTANDMATKFVAQAKTAADAKLAPIASELTSKIAALTSSVGSNETITSKLESTLAALTSGQDASALSSVFEISKVAEAAKLTPQQLGLAKEVGSLASAFVVQKDFAALEGAQGDVATIVKSLRAGEITAAIPALKNVATNVNLTNSQKQLITSIADQYAPGWQKAAQTLDAIKKLPGLGN